MALRTLFLGTADFAVPSLEALAREHEVLAVVTQPDRPRGRGRSVAPPPVKVAAQRLGLPVLQPERLRKKEVRLQLMAYAPDAIVVAAYGQILAPRLLAGPRLGCINVHASLLPRHRGAAPIQWAVLSGDARAGVTIMQMDAGVDTGPMLLAEGIEVAADETAGSLHDRLAPLGGALLVRALAGVAAGSLPPQAQDETAATLAPQLRKEDGLVDFTRPCAEVDRWIRGMDPWPGAFTRFEGELLKLYRSRADQGSGRPGQVLVTDERGILVACGAGAVWIHELQLPGRRRMPAAALLLGRPIAIGALLGADLAEGERERP